MGALSGHRFSLTVIHSLTIGTAQMSQFIWADKALNSRVQPNGEWVQFVELSAAHCRILSHVAHLGLFPSHQEL